MHEAPAAMKPPDKVIDPEVLVTVPPHWEAVGALATVIPLGNVSVNPIPVISVRVFELDIVKLSVLVPPVSIPDGEKLLDKVGGRIFTTFKVSWAGFPDPPSVERGESVVFV